MSKYTFSFLTVLFACSLLLSHSNIRKHPTLEYPEKTTQTLLNINNWAGWIYWDGISGYDPVGNLGVIYPRGTAGVVHSDGIVWGGFTNDGTTPALRAGGQYYYAGTQPGKIISLGVAQNPGDPEVQIYRIRSDYLTVSDVELRRDAAEINLVHPSQVTQAMIDGVRAGYTRAWNQWPGDLGAPYYDHNGNGIWDPGIDEPGLLNAQQVIWFACNDLDSGLTTYLLGSPPMGIELQVTMWGYKTGSGMWEAAYRRYRLINKSGYPIDSMYVGQFSDPNVGYLYDDVVGCDSVISLGFAYNGEPGDSYFDAFGIPPPAIGYVILQGPIVPSPGDTALFNFQKKADFKNLPMTSFGYCLAGSAEWDDPDLHTYDGTLQWYNYLRGFLPLRDIMNPYPFTHRGTWAITKFPLNGDPVSGIGDVDGIGYNFAPSDRRIAVCSGPFTLLNGDTQEVVLAIVGGLGTDYLQSVAEMKKNVINIKNGYGEPVFLPAAKVNVNFPNNQQSDVHYQVNLQDLSSVNSCEVFFEPQQGSEPPFNLDLYDDGQHGDSLAGDQIWGNSITVTNRQYPYRADLIANQAASIDTFPGLIRDIRLRPEPQLSGWQLNWENGLQDNSLNSGETVHYRFTVKNIDLNNNISQFTVAHAGYGGTYNAGISPGKMVSSDSFYLVVTAPLGTDSVTARYFIDFDGHTLQKSITFPVANWTPPASWGDTLWVRSVWGVTENLFPVVADATLLNGHRYRLTFFEDLVSGIVHWQLIDETSGQLKVDKGISTNNPFYAHPVVDGIIFIMKESIPDFKSFQVVANGAGPIDPPEMGCFAFNNNGFPLLFNARYPQGTDRPTAGVQQSTNMSVWGVHTGMTRSNDGTYSYFIYRITRNANNWDSIIPYDYEMRFTSAGGYANWAFENEETYRVPFELWSLGIHTLNDPSDDYRMIPWVLNDAGPFAPDDSVYNINPSDHVVSENSDDPYMDWVYWRHPADRTPGTAGYDDFVSRSLAGRYFPNTGDTEAMIRITLVNLDGGDVNDPAFPANLDAVIPEEGTIFRIITTKPNLPGDTLQVIASLTGLNKAVPPYTYELWQNYPNPFNPTTTIRFSLGAAEKVKLEIFNVLGQRIGTLLDRWLPAGKYREIWDARNEAGLKLGSGIYFYRITAGDYVQTRKMILLK
ncbi:MAG: T9SS type A sorting domain-containing protein [bacterium]|nr:MAG: T9SS type A sorting domain-containing protein [bacterium]